MNRMNEHGLVAAHVLLWALQQSTNRELSPGYYLPHPEAIQLARYMVARYGAHHVVARDPDSPRIRSSRA